MNRKEKPTNIKIGSVFGKLTVVDVLYKQEKTQRIGYALCNCSCGNKNIEKRIQNLRSNTTFSCGCKYLERNERHGMSYTVIYQRWRCMLDRCYKTTSNGYQSYGGSGITVCDEWRGSFSSFYTWAINNGYKDSLYLDRIDNSKGYYPENCRYVTLKQQGRNKKTNHLLTIFNETKTVVEWAEDDRCSVSYSLFRQRINCGIDPEIALTTIKFKQRKGVKRITAFNEEKTIKEWSEDMRCLVCEELLRNRLEKGWGPEEAITTGRLR